MDLVQAIEVTAGALPAILVYAQADALIDDPVTTILRHTLYMLPLTAVPLIGSCGAVKTFAAFVSATTLGTAALYILSVLLGAPVVSLVQETASLCLFCATVALMPLFAHGRRSMLPTVKALQEPGGLVNHFLRDNRASGRAVGTLAGAYLGCVPIPLDWDRPWQRWPVTVYIGACIGLAMGSVAGAMLAEQRSVQTSATSAAATNPPRQRRQQQQQQQQQRQVKSS